MATTPHLLILVVFLVLAAGSARAQLDFCEGESSEDDNFGKRNFGPRHFGRRYSAPPADACAVHDLVLGNCSQLRAVNMVTDKVCADPVPGGIAYRVPSYFFHHSYKIYCIKVVDRLEDGTGGFPVIESGGLGFDHVTIYYYSQLNHGLRFYAEVYAGP